MDIIVQVCLHIYNGWQITLCCYNIITDNIILIIFKSLVVVAAMQSVCTDIN